MESEDAPGDVLLPHAVEAILLAAGGPVSVASLASATASRPSEVQAALLEVRASLRGGVRLQIHGDKAQLVTAPECAEAVARYLGVARPPALSRAALETLAVVAYRQPVTRAEIEAARGVDSVRAVHTLVARGLIEEVGARSTPGRPSEYGTTADFLAYFGLESIDDLPAVETSEQSLSPVQLGLRGGWDPGSDVGAHARPRTPVDPPTPDR